MDRTHGGQGFFQEAGWLGGKVLTGHGEDAGLSHGGLQHLAGEAGRLYQVGGVEDRKRAAGQVGVGAVGGGRLGDLKVGIDAVQSGQGRHRSLVAGGHQDMDPGFPFAMKQFHDKNLTVFQ